jgi:Domain of unknown function (DUF4431)
MAAGHCLVPPRTLNGEGMRILIWVAAILFSLPCGASSEAPWLEFQPSPVSLTGQFELVVRFGPPNYGEDPKSDSKLDVPMLLLDEPIRVRGRPGDEIDDESVEGIRMVQLLLPNNVDRQALIGKKVTVNGELSHATRGPEFTPIVMTVKKIRDDETHE